MRTVGFVVVLAVVAAGCASSSSGTSGIHGVAMMGPTCGGPVRDPPQPGCADKPYHGSLAITTEAGDVVKTFETAADGLFNVTVAPGIYRVASPAEQGLPSCASHATFIVRSGLFTYVPVDCDTGMR